MGCCWSPGGSRLEGAPAGPETRGVAGTTQPSLPAHPSPPKKEEVAQGVLASYGCSIRGEDGTGRPAPQCLTPGGLLSSFPFQLKHPFLQEVLPHGGSQAPHHLPFILPGGPENFSLGHLNYGLPAAGVSGGFLKTLSTTLCVSQESKSHILSHTQGLALG